MFITKGQECNNLISGNCFKHKLISFGYKMCIQLHKPNLYSIKSKSKINIFKKGPDQGLQVIIAHKSTF